MKSISRGAWIGLAFAVPSGVLAVWALWIMVLSSHNAWVARDWVAVNAQVVAVQRTKYDLYATYRYSYKGRDYNGTRLSIMGGDVDAGKWTAAMTTYLQAAHTGKTPIRVHVNDARPADAVVDRALRWPVMIYMTVDMVVMGAIAMGAAWLGFGRKGGGPRAPAPRPQPPRAAPRFATDGPAYEFSPRESPPATNVAIPPDIATVRDLGSRITIHYEGGLMDVLAGKLTVTASGTELRVERTAPFGLFKREDFVAPQSTVSTLGAAARGVVTEGTEVTRYYALFAATTDGRHVDIGRRLPGEAVANALLLRIAKALKFSIEDVWIARAPSP